jgi:hypothetical protein
VRFVSANPLAATLLAFTLMASTRPAWGESEGDDLAIAARAFQRGQRAQLHREFRRAAELFELADDTAPRAAALRSAIRNWDAAGNSAHAATLAMRAIELYPSDAETIRLATAVVARRGPALGSLRGRCKPECLLSVDGRTDGQLRAVRHDLYLSPGEHALVADFGEGRVTQQRLHVNAGQLREVALQPASTSSRPQAARQFADDDSDLGRDWPSLDEPSRPSVGTTARPPSGDSLERPAPEAAQPRADAAVRPPADGAAIVAGPPRRDRRLPPLAPVLGIGLTLGLGAVLAWSVSDTIAAHDRYVAHPTVAGYNDGVSREARTNGLIGGVVVLGAATLVIALFATNWQARFAGGSRGVTRAQRLWPQLGLDTRSWSAGVAASLD